MNIKLGLGIPDRILNALRTCGCMTTLTGAVEGWAPMGAGPSGRARWRKVSLSAIVRLPSEQALSSCRTDVLVLRAECAAGQFSILSAKSWRVRI